VLNAVIAGARQTQDDRNYGIIQSDYFGSDASQQHYIVLGCASCSDPNGLRLTSGSCRRFYSAARTKQIRFIHHAN
jgi:hypothetical protein